MCLGICEMNDGVPAAADAPQTLGGAMRQFGRQITALKKQDKLAGQIERELEQNSKSLLREAARETMQARADACSPHCPVCGAPLEQVERRERTILTQWGQVTLSRAYGRCPCCQKNFAPADDALGLEKSQQTSPALAEKLSYLTTMLPPGQVAEVFEHLTGQPIAPAKVEREAKKKGEQALFERRQDLKRALDTETRADFSRENRPPDEPEDFTLVLMMDAWMIRERDDWGLSEALRKQGLRPERWHDVKSARLFRLDQRAVDQNGRPLLLSSHVVATRGDAAAFSELVFCEAVRWGALRASRVLVVADGGVWIWNIAQDRFSWADTLTLDFYHAVAHLWTVGNALFGEGSEAARVWVEGLRHKLRHGQHKRVVKTLADLAQMGQELEIAAVLEREAAYFGAHAGHLDYAAKARRGEPIGSGAMESACKQYQLRFKRPGQFWSQEEGLLELYSRRLSGRWESLWPHLSSQN
jgi:hypothetical protein